MDGLMISHFENDAIQEKKVENYGWEKKDFLAGQELTVTITLGEYRELVAKNATSEQAIRASNEKTSKAEAALKEALAEAERLKAENYDLQSKIMAMQGGKAQRPVSVDPFDPPEEGSDDE